MRRTFVFLSLLLSIATVAAPAGSGRQDGRPPAQDVRAEPVPEFVTPPIYESMQVTMPDGARFDEFGHAVAVRGTTVFVGAPGADNASGVETGAVYVLDHSDGGWTITARLTPADGPSSADFGSALAVDGNTLVVGAPGVRIGSNFFQGAAYVFEESGNQWGQVARLTAPDGGPSLYFGRSVAISGSTIVAGAPYASVTNFRQGAAYVFSRPDATWLYDTKLAMDDGADHDEFGAVVATSGGVVVVGSAWAGSYSGVVRAYARQDDGWNQEMDFVPPWGAYRFGASVNFAGDTLLVGAAWAAGTVFQYTRVDHAWSEPVAIVPAGQTGNAEFGASLARDGNLLLVGAPATYVAGASGYGAAHLFRLVDGTWTEQLLLAPSTYVSEPFNAPALVRGEVVSGNYGADVGANPDQGAVFWWGMAPVAQAVTPRVVPTAGGSTVTITGRYLMPGATATIGGLAAADPAAIDPQTLSVVTPARPPGAADIVVTNADGRSDTLAAGLTVGDTDLTIAAVKVPAAIGQEVPVLVNATTKNAGKHRTVTTVTRFYLSADAVLDANDRILASHKVPALSAGRTYTAWASVTIPRSVAAGQYSLFAVADVTGVVTELNETNNARMVRVKVGCDATISNLVAPAKVRAGEGFRATVTTANLGPGPAARSTTRLYLSPDSTKGNDSRLGERLLGTTNAGTVSVWRGAFAIPGTVAAGSYYLIAAADDDSELSEVGRDNNVRIKPIAVLPAITRPVKAK